MNLVDDVQRRSRDLRRRFLAQDPEVYRKETQYFDHYLKEVFPDELKCLKLRTEGKLGSKGKLNLGETELLFMLVGFSKEPCLLATSLHKPKYLVLIHSLETEVIAEELKATVGDVFKGIIHQEAPSIKMLTVSASEPKAVYDTIFKEWNDEWKDKCRQETAVMDITGGTNTMVSGAYLVALKIGLKTYYLDFEEYDSTFRLPRAATNFYSEFLPEELRKEIMNM